MLVLKNEFKPEALIQNAFTPTAFEVVEMTQLLFWLKINTLIALNEEVKIMEAYTKFCISFFKPFELVGIGRPTDTVLKSIWRINFVNENYKSIEAYCRNNNDKSQQWMVNLLAMLQECYFEVAKTYCPFRPKQVASAHQAAAHFHLLQTLLRSEDEFFSEEFRQGDLDLDVRKLYNKSEQFVISSLANCTNNLLNHVYFKSHPRAFLTKYISSLDIHLSLRSKYSLDSAASWIERATDRLHLSQPFPEIFKILAVNRSMYHLRQTDTVSAILSLLEILNSKFASPDLSADYQTAAAIARELSARLAAPVSRYLEKLVAIDNGMLTINE